MFKTCYDLVSMTSCDQLTQMGDDVSYISWLADCDMWLSQHLKQVWQWVG